MSDGITPGRWIVEAWSAKEGQVVAVNHGSRSLICAGVMNADAYVIAAAPDLLSVARTMLPANLCLTNPNVRDETVVPLEVTMGELRKIAAVVAKAQPA